MPLTPQQELELLELEEEEYQHQQATAAGSKKLSEEPSALAKMFGIDKEKLAAANTVKSELDAKAKQFDENAPWYAKLFAARPNVSTPSPVEAMNYASGLVNTGADELMTRLRTKLAEGSPSWSAARKGEAPSMPEVLQRQGLGPVASNVIGLPVQALTDPTSSIMMGAGSLKSFGKPNVWSALKQNVGQNIPGANAISAGLEKTGKSIYRMPFLKVEKEMASYADSGRYKPYEYADTMMDRGVKGSARAQKEQLENFREGAREKYVSATEGYEADLAPRATTEGLAAADEAVEKYIQQSTQGYKDALIANGMDEVEAEAKALQDVESPLRVKAQDPDDADFKIIREDGEDAYKVNLKSKLRAGLAGEKHLRQRTLEKLKEYIPSQFHETVTKLTSKLDGPEREVAQKGLDDIINTTMAGPKNLADLDDMAAQFGMKAAGSDQMSSNVYKATSKKSTGKASAAKTGSGMKGVIKEQLTPEDLATFEEGRREYGLWARGKRPAFTVLDNAVSTPAITAVDGLLLGANQLPAVAVKKGIQGLRAYPQISSRIGLGLRGASKTNIWDNMARSALLNQAREEEK